MNLKQYSDTKAYTEYNLSENIKGDLYPYILDGLKIKATNIYPKSVWVEDESGNKYAVNGNAFVYLTKIKKDNKFIGYTTDILKNGHTDESVLTVGFMLCQKREMLKKLKTSNFVMFLYLLFVIFISYLAFTDVQPGLFIKTYAVLLMLSFANDIKMLFKFWREI